MPKPSIFDLVEEPQYIPTKQTKGSRASSIFDIPTEESSKEPAIRRSDYTGPRAGSLPALLGFGDKENPQYNEAPVIPIVKSVIRGAGKLIAGGVREAEEYKNIFGAPNIIKAGKTPEESENAIVGKLPYESSDPLLRGVERGAELSLFGAPFKIPGVLGGFFSGTAGQTSKELTKPLVGEKASGYIQTGTEVLAVPSLAFRQIYPKLYNLFQGLTKQGKANKMAQGLNLSELSPGEYKVLSEEIVPEIRQNYQIEYDIRRQQELAEFEKQYNQELANTKAKHLNEWQEKERIDALNADYQAKVQEIEAKYAAEKAQFDEQMANFEQYNSRNEAVRNSLGIRGASRQPLAGRVTQNAPDLGIRPAPPQAANPTFSDRVLNRIARGQIENKTRMGEVQNGIIESSANYDYRNVNQAYQESRAAQANMNGIHPELVDHLQEWIAQLNRIQHHNPMQERSLRVSNDLLDMLTVRNAEGEITGLRPVNSQDLLDQAQAIRYYMDYEFRNANPSGIFRPTLQAIDTAVENLAQHLDNPEAVQLNRAARQAYAEWTDLYNNPYINPYRSTTNHDYIKLFNDSLNIDNFRRIERVLNRTNFGSEVANVTRRSIVEKQLDKFLKDPLGTSIQDFDRALAELEPILQGGEVTPAEIRAEYMAERRASTIRARKQTGKPEKVNKPTKETKPTKPPAPIKVKEVKIPTRGKFSESKELKAIAEKLKITESKVMKMADTPEGLRELKADLSRSEAGRKLINKVHEHKLRDILFEGKVLNRPTGEQMFNQANKPNNFALLSEILGEKEATQLLVELDKIGTKSMTRKVIEHVVKDAAVIKTLRIIGLLG